MRGTFSCATIKQVRCSVPGATRFPSTRWPEARRGRSGSARLSYRWAGVRLRARIAEDAADVVVVRGLREYRASYVRQSANAEALPKGFHLLTSLRVTPERGPHRFALPSQAEFRCGALGDASGQ
jgi:hypothetical protein